MAKRAQRMPLLKASPGKGGERVWRNKGRDIEQLNVRPQTNNCLVPAGSPEDGGNSMNIPFLLEFTCWSTLDLAFYSAARTFLKWIMTAPCLKFSRALSDPCGSVGWASAHKAKGHQFNSQSGHMPAHGCR
ncbi:hypothetical protein HJG60_009152 [Phyllostomus discolor]|uniref:Uncharacterized protein n=1 Tax=Phyllostomus discolor TaxID=89673 RepID=A0A834DF26_9CHIR|nr:hypothetical protein HJG60_009152 [Phyllostomus discolor]